MRGRSVARPFAAALFELAGRQGATEEWGGALETIVGLFEEEEAVREFLETPRVSAEEKKAVLGEALGGRVPAEVLNFLLLVLDRRRLRFLRPIADEYRALLDERLGRAHVEVSVARELDPAEVEELRGSLSRILGKEAVAHIQVRPEIVGGVVFKSQDMIYDGSVRRRLDRMKQRLLAADV